MQLSHINILPSGSNSGEEESWEVAYAEYLAEKQAAAARDDQDQPTGTMGENDEGETWELQYAAYCAEKEAVLNERELQSRSQAD